MSPTARISDHFTWREATVTLQRNRETGLLMRNEPDPDNAARLVHTFQELEKVRAKFDRPLVIHSAYRSPEVNGAVGGSPTSQHMRGEAVDFHVEGLTVREAFGQLRGTSINYDQLIEEAGTWLHISFAHNRTARRQALKMRIEDGRAVYAPA